MEEEVLSFVIQKYQKSSSKVITQIKIEANKKNKDDKIIEERYRIKWRKKR